MVAVLPCRLLQTEQYAWALFRSRWPDDAEGVQRRVIARMARRTVLSRPDAPALVLTVTAGPTRTA